MKPSTDDRDDGRLAARVAPMDKGYGNEAEAERHAARQRQLKAGLLTGTAAACSIA